MIRNEDMTEKEASQAKKQLKNNFLPPALSTRSNVRGLRSNNIYIYIYNYFLNKHTYYNIYYVQNVMAYNKIRGS